MNSYIDKIYYHKKLNFEDIKQMCMDQAKKLELNEYVKNVNLDNIITDIASYDYKNKIVYVSPNGLKYNFKGLKKISFKPYIIENVLCNNIDLYNLYVISTIFHELWHAWQLKEINENSDSDYSILLESSYINTRFSGTLYENYHNRYFCEHDANINSIILTLNFIKPFNLNKVALQTINKDFAREIFKGYGIRENKEFYDEYNSPLEFFHFFDNDNIGQNEREDNILKKLEIFFKIIKFHQMILII